MNTFLCQVSTAFHYLHVNHITAFHYLHVNHIVHGDLRAEHVYVVAPNKVSTIYGIKVQ